MQYFRALTTAAASLLCISPAGAEPSATMNLHANVPIVCKLAYHGEPAQGPEGYTLGRLHEYCNAPSGFVVEVEYQPGTLHGTILKLGDRELLLDGSGHGEMGRTSGPKIADLQLAANLANVGTRSSSLGFRITPL